MAAEEVDAHNAPSSSLAASSDFIHLPIGVLSQPRQIATALYTYDRVKFDRLLDVAPTNFPIVCGMSKVPPTRHVDTASRVRALTNYGDATETPQEHECGMNVAEASKTKAVAHRGWGPNPRPQD